MAKYQVEMHAWEAEHLVNDPGNTGWPRGWADPATATAEWETMELPQLWQSAGLNYSGYYGSAKRWRSPRTGRATTLTLAHRRLR